MSKEALLLKPSRIQRKKTKRKTSKWRTQISSGMMKNSHNVDKAVISKEMKETTAIEVAAGTSEKSST